MHILLVGGSPAASSITHHLLSHIDDRLRVRDHHPQRLQLCEVPARALLLAERADPAIKAIVQQVARADALVLATPIYQRAYSGMIKVFLDLLEDDALAGKLVLPVATGAGVGNMLDLDYALRPVLSALAATHVLTSIYASHDQLAWSDEGGLALAPTIASRVNYAVNELSAALLARQRQRLQQERRRPPAPVRARAGAQAAGASVNL